VSSATQMMQSQDGVSDFAYNEEDITISEVSGKKLTGTFNINNQSAVFNQYLFINDQAVQQVVFIRKTADNYASEIMERMEKSIQLQTTVSAKE
jgi:hypothetical protein